MIAQQTTVDKGAIKASIPHSLEFSWKAAPWSAWSVVAIAILLLGYLYEDSLRFLAQTWLEDDNYSHGPFIPLISLYLIWLRRDQLRAVSPKGLWLGIPLIAVGSVVYAVGQYAAMQAGVLVSLWIVVVGFVLCLVGSSGVPLLAFPLLYLLTAVPLPEFLHYELSSRLQLISSALGVGCLQLIGVMAYRDGNVIDLGPMQLQVVEACSGLRSLFPLTALTLLCAYFYQEAVWKRVLLFASSIPISILLNGFRIGSIGILVDGFGQSAAEGFSHFFEGWIFFVASLALLYGEMWVLARIGPNASKRPLTELIAPPSWQVRKDSESPSATNASPRARFSAVPALIGCALLTSAAWAAPAISPDQFLPSARESLMEFPLQLGDWRGASVALEQHYLEVLQLDDYLLANYVAPQHGLVNVYLAYYQSPKKGRSSHSPKTCIPGGGWEITSFEPLHLNTVSGSAGPLEVNRVVIQKDASKQIVYYWFKQRDRWITSEYAVKFFLFWDSITRHRADGALVRLVSEVSRGEEEARADERLETMARLVSPLLSRYVPD